MRGSDLAAIRSVIKWYSFTHELRDGLLAQGQ